MIEEWRPIPGYEPWYEVSNLGRIKVLAYEFESIRGNTRCIVHRSDKILNPTVAKSVGCRICTLTNRCTGRSNYAKIYHIVAKVFNGMEPEVVIHKDGNMSNDCTTNLVHKFNQNDNANELWLPIPGYEGLYEISNLGRVRSLGRLVSHGASHAIRKPAKLLKFAEDADGYFNVGLFDLQGRCKQFRVNRLVAITFIPNPDNLPIVNHIDGNKQNNSVSNLEWCTVRYNTFEAYNMGLNPNSNPIPVICLTNGIKFDSIQAAAKWAGCDHENIRESISIKSCCKGGYCFVKESDYPDNPEEYLEQAQNLYNRNQKYRRNFNKKGED